MVSWPDGKITGPNLHLLKRDSNGYPDVPGSGPTGERCKTCANIRGFQQGGSWFKCELRRTAWTGGRGTDIKANSPACSKWESDGIDRTKKTRASDRGSDWMPALSLHQPFANWVADGSKPLETRTWAPFIKTPFDLLIVSTKKKDYLGEKRQGPFGVALCVVTVTGFRNMVGDDEKLARCPLYPKAKVWFLENVRRVAPVSIVGRQLIYWVPKSDVRFNILEGSCLRK